MFPNLNGFYPSQCNNGPLNSVYPPNIINYPPYILYQLPLPIIHSYQIYQNLPAIWAPSLEASRPDINMRSVQIPVTPIKKKKTIRNTCPQTNLKSAKKNSVSNIVNQCYSWLSCPVSQNVVKKVVAKLGLARDEKRIISVFYLVVNVIRRQKGRKYSSIQSLLNIFTPMTFSHNSPKAKQILQKTEAMTSDEFCYIFRICSYQFLRDHSFPAFLTYKRFYLPGKVQAIKKGRKLQKLAIK